MEKFLYSQEEIGLIKEKLDFFIDKLLTNENNNFFILQSYSIDSVNVQIGWFKKKTETAYFISSLKLKTERGEVNHTNDSLCTHHAIQYFSRMKSNTDSLISSLKKLDYSIVKNIQ